MNAFTALYFQNEGAARAAFEAIRWPNGPVCPRCGESQRYYATNRPSRYRCGNPECRKDFSATTGTVMERSHIPITKWLMGFYLMGSSKKGVSAHQLHRSLGIKYQSAWFMAHRIREAMRDGGLLPPMGGEGGIVEADEDLLSQRLMDRRHVRLVRKNARKSKQQLMRECHRIAPRIVRWNLNL